jgi:hypothetical protein
MSMPSDLVREGTGELSIIVPEQVRGEFSSTGNRVLHMCRSPGAGQRSRRTAFGTAGARRRGHAEAAHGQIPRRAGHCGESPKGSRGDAIRGTRPECSSGKTGAICEERGGCTRSNILDCRVEACGTGPGVHCSLWIGHRTSDQPLCRPIRRDRKHLVRGEHRRRGMEVDERGGQRGRRLLRTAHRHAGSIHRDGRCLAQHRRVEHAARWRGRAAGGHRRPE